MSSTISKKLSLIMALFLIISFYPWESNAIPAFARKNSIACSGCHTAWPMLNNTGRRYKENGYRFASGEMPGIKLSDDLRWDESLPVSVVLVARPYDKKDSGEKKLRAIHEAELMVGGPMGEKMSGFFEIEAEDEVTNGIGLDAGVPAATLTYNQNNQVNLQFSYADILWFDSYNTFSHARRLSRSDNAVVDQSFGGADNDGKLRSSRQNIALYGRPVDALFYGLAMSGVADEAEGVDGQTVTLRLAYDVMPEVMIGGVVIDGSCSAKISTVNCTVDRDYNRTAVDFQARLNGLLLSGVFMQAEDDNTTATVEEKNNAAYLQAVYVVRDNGRAKWVPFLRYDQYEKNDGVEEIKEFTVNLGHYFTENIHAYVEYWDRSGDGVTVDDDRLTLQLMAAF